MSFGRKKEKALYRNDANMNITDMVYARYFFVAHLQREYYVGRQTC